VAADALNSHWVKHIHYLDGEDLMKEKPTSRWKDITKIDVTYYSALCTGMVWFKTDARGEL